MVNFFSDKFCVTLKQYLFQLCKTPLFLELTGSDQTFERYMSIEHLENMSDYIWKKENLERSVDN